MPDEQPKKRRSAKATKKRSELIEALRHISLVQRDLGNETQTHCTFKDGFLSACDGILAAGVFVQEDLALNPHTHLLLKALEHCEETIALTARDGRLAVRSGPFRALIKCQPEGLPAPLPDPVAGEVPDSLRAALSIAGTLASDTAPKLLHASVLLTAGSCFGTNSVVLIEAWHGQSVPTVVLPKAFVSALGKLAKPIKQFGFSENSFTIYFEDRSWLRTQLYGDNPWPDVQGFLNVASVPVALPENFFKACETVALFAKEDDVYVCADYVSSVATLDVSDQGAVVELPGANFGAQRHLDGNALALVKDYAKTADFSSHPKGMLFFGDNVRGVVAYRL